MPDRRDGGPIPPVSNSSASCAPHSAAIANACDAHLHIYDPCFAAIAPVVANATVEDYRGVQGLLGTSRAVIVQPRCYGTDNSATLDAIRKLGFANARGVAVVRPDVTDETLHALHAGGIRGIRFSLYTEAHAVVGFEMVEALANRVAELGWHLQLHWTADQIVAHRDLLARLRTPLVFDHLARLPLPEGTTHPAFALVSGLLAGGNAWLKLSGAYLDSVVGAAGRYADIDPVAMAWVRTAPERLVWGSDWPHSTETRVKPDDALLYDLLAHWTDTDAERQRILVDNPALLYGFETA
ncbi:amidohydrolase family protein (plasmid) [Cupriavidus necator]|uniref:2-pyrone-4,6-dicarboxylate hydrolase n=1 Tax=Cupriavidus necator TaxID=106590 RepID=A0A367P8J9_CUPNE|nr:amidohydrolase family protein [Cupriavidus necator]QQX89792.1 amidohydrolase family protein [Cupriavidus necator]RCJ03505.1 2-pyrone-4,6-dicarboxylate hydrolase [Cupriavidus necator]